MIGRRSTQRLAAAAHARFAQSNGAGRGLWIPWDDVYDFCYSHDFETAFLNAIEAGARDGERGFEEFILKLHTGESVASLRHRKASDGDALEGQVFLRQFAQAILADFYQSAITSEDANIKTLQAALEWGKKDRKHGIHGLLKSLELDGYAWVDGNLIHRESAPVDAEKQRELIGVLGGQLGLGKLDVLAHNLKLSEGAYQDGRWEDCVGNARKAMELCFQECASLWSRRVLGQELDAETYKWAGKVRDFLNTHTLLTDDEKKATAASYGLFSGVGNHPYIAQHDQARMGRQIALILAEFVLLRTAGALKDRKK